MLTKYYLVASALLMLSVPAQAQLGEAFLPVEHCSYDPYVIKPAVHQDHAGRCDNTDDTTAGGGAPYPGSCDYSSGFYWTAINCNTDQIFGCELAGQIRCPDGHGGYTMRTYNFYCPQGMDSTGNFSPLPAASAGKTEAKCRTEANGDDGQMFPYSIVCDCNTSQAAWDYNCNPGY